jgi:hypothetical protein
MDDIVKLPTSAAYKPTNYAFGTLANNIIAWETCRDRFQATSNPEGYLFFLFNCVNDSGSINVIEFIRMVEQIIKLPEKDSVVFKKTSVKGIIHVTMSLWWKYRLRRSLLTALLRCGVFYTDHSGPEFEKALFSQVYTSGTRAAIERFLAGYTASRLKKRTPFYGWQAFFAAGGNTTSEAALVKLKKKKKNEEAIEATKEE